MERTCTTPGCSKPHRARGLCATCYNQQHQTPEQRHPKMTVPCTQCGTPCVKDKGREKRYGGLFCSSLCREAWKAINGYTPSAEHMAMMQDRRSTRYMQAKRKLRTAARGSYGTTWVAGNCARCGKPFVSAVKNDLGRYCSDHCSSKARASRRRARTRGVEHEPYARTAIFERDGWRCHLCKRRVVRAQVVPHPQSPVIDHLIPIADGGPDTPGNVATAHFMCNSVRRDVGQAQLLLFG